MWQCVTNGCVSIVSNDSPNVCVCVCVCIVNPAIKLANLTHTGHVMARNPITIQCVYCVPNIVWWPVLIGSCVCDVLMIDSEVVCDVCCGLDPTDICNVWQYWCVWKIQ